MTEPENSVPDDDRVPAVEPPPAQRPDWLVGADEGVTAEQGRQKSAGTPLPFKLNSAADRAADPEVAGANEVQRPVAPIRPVAPQGPPAPPKPVAWTAAASSVPTLKGQSAPVAPKPARPAAGAGESGPARAGAPANAAARRGAAASEPVERAPMPDFDPPADGEEAAASFPTESAPARPRPIPRPLEEPWWVIGLDTLRANRTVQLGIVGAILITLTVYFFWPHSEPGVSLRSLRHDAARWDGHIVRVEGRVGDVFPMGDGYAYNLHQGRDTIVVFTRTHHPVSRQNVTVVGSVTTGFLDGEARQAIFEN